MHFATPDSMNPRASSRQRGAHPQRRIIVEVAISADDYIARPDGDVGWLDRPQPRNQYGLAAFVKTIDTILLGRKTYAKGIELGMKAGEFGPKVRSYVFSRGPQEPLLQGFELARGPIKAFARRLREQAGKDIWMMGGSEIIAAFLDEGEIDELSLHVLPVLIGEGIPLIQPRHRSIPLELLSTRKFPDGVVHLQYRVTKFRGSRKAR